MKNNTSIIPSKTPLKGSLADMMKVTGQSLPDLMTNVQAVVVVDLSGSMEERLPIDSTMPVPASMNYGSYITKADLAGVQLKQLQEDHAGAIAVFTFSEECIMVPSGNLKDVSVQDGMWRGTRFLSIVNNPYIHRLNRAGKKTIIISDGAAYERDEDLLAAFAGWKSLYTIYIGDGGMADEGAKLLKKLSDATHGANSINKPASWVKVVEPLLLDTGISL